METFSYFLHLCQQTWSFLIYLWPITLIFLASFLLSVVQAYYQKKQKIIFYLALGMTTFIVSILLLLWGSIYRQQGQGLKAISLQASLMGITIFLGQMLYEAYLVAKVPGYRFLVGAIVGLQVWVSCYAFIVANMAITGDWF